MREEEIIHRTSEPATRKSLAEQLQALGVSQGRTMLVHSSLSSLGWVCGAAQAVVEALLDAVGPEGTLVMPTHTSDLSEPSFWCNPPVPTNWWPIIRESMPAFDPATSQPRAMGRIVDCFRTMPGVVRSQHPQYSFAAIGPNAEAITKDHQFNFSLGEGSPLARIYDLNGSVLLLGVGHDRNTSLHLAEYRMDMRPNKPIENGAPVVRNGKREWISLQDIENHSGDFLQLGSDFAIKFRDQPEILREGKVGQGRAQLISQPALVDFAKGWMEKHR